MDIKKDDLLINPPKQFRPISLLGPGTHAYIKKKQPGKLRRWTKPEPAAL